MSGSSNPTDPSDLSSKIVNFKLFISERGNIFFVKDKIFEISCLKPPCDLEVSFMQRNPQIVML